MMTSLLECFNTLQSVLHSEVTKSFNMSIMLGKLPDRMESLQSGTITKKGNNSDPGNYQSDIFVLYFGQTTWEAY